MESNAVIQRTLDSVITPDMDKFAIVYLDDIIVIGKTFNEHLANLQIVFDKLRAVNLKINPEKCTFCRPELKYLGHVVSRSGIHTDPDKVQKIHW